MEYEKRVFKGNCKECKKEMHDDERIFDGYCEKCWNKKPRLSPMGKMTGIFMIIFLSSSLTCLYFIVRTLLNYFYII